MVEADHPDGARPAVAGSVTGDDAWCWEQTVTTAAMPVTLETIWREFSRDLHDFIARRVARPEDADDILQVVFVRGAGWRRA